MRVRRSAVTAALLSLVLVTGCSSKTSGTAAVASGAVGVAATSAASVATTDTAATGDAGSSDSSSSSQSSTDSTDGSASQSSDTGDTGTSSSSETSTEDLPSVPNSIPGISGVNGDCLSVASTYAAIELSFLSVLGGTGTYNGATVLGQMQQLLASVPAELKPDFNELIQAVQQANGKGLSDAANVLESAPVKKAGDDIKAWLDKNCGGG